MIISDWKIFSHTRAIVWNRQTKFAGYMRDKYFDEEHHTKSENQNCANITNLHHVPESLGIPANSHEVFD